MKRAIRKRLAIKGAIVLALLLLNLFLMVRTARDNREYAMEQDGRTQISMFDRYVSRGEYGRLREALLLYDTRGEAFDSYWEIADSYEYLMRYKVWAAAAVDGENRDTEAAAQAETWKKQLEITAAESRFPRNKDILENMASQVQ